MTTPSTTIGTESAQWASTPNGWELTLPNGSTTLITKEAIAPFATEGQTQQGFITFEGKQWPYAVAYSATQVFLWVAGQTFTLPKPITAKGRRHGKDSNAGARSSGTISATMPGNIVSVAVTTGKTVQAGDVLVVMESMKMELSLTSAIAGSVTAVHIAEGDKVAIGQVLVEVTPTASEESAS